jgi:hypothetical protein
VSDFPYLDGLEDQLIEATGRALLDGGLTERKIPGAARRLRRARGGLLVGLAVLLALTAAALAATGIFSTGSPVRPGRPLSGTAGVGMPARGGVRLLSLSVPDPAGGLPWGMRIVNTTRGLRCLQIGRLYHGELGVLGKDGAFGDDGRFHPLPPDALGLDVGGRPGPRAIVSCQGPDQSSSQELSGVPESGVTRSPSAKRASPVSDRWISFGLLGPRAESVTYRYRGRSHTVAVAGDGGAYLVVLPAQPGRFGEEGGGATGQQGAYLQPQGVLSSITYRLANGTCHTVAPAKSTCPEHGALEPHRPARNLHRPIHVSLQPSPTGTEEDASVTFTAPYGVSSALSGYAIQTPSACHRGATGTTLERDVRPGEVIHARFEDLFANACGPTVDLQVLFYSHSPGPRLFTDRGAVIVGEVKVKRLEIKRPR